MISINPSPTPLFAGVRVAAPPQQTFSVCPWRLFGAGVWGWNLRPPQKGQGGPPAPITHRASGIPGQPCPSPAPATATTAEAGQQPASPPPAGGAAAAPPRRPRGGARPPPAPRTPRPRPPTERTPGGVCVWTGGGGAGGGHTPMAGKSLKRGPNKNWPIWVKVFKAVAKRKCPHFLASPCIVFFSQKNELKYVEKIDFFGQKQDDVGVKKETLGILGPLATHQKHQEVLTFPFLSPLSLLEAEWPAPKA